jgi:tetratricopeptide (TPR) repeat protein
MRKILIPFLLWTSFSLFAQDFGVEIYYAYISSDMDRWESIMERMESDWTERKDSELLYELTEAQYGFIGYCIAEKRKKEAKVYIEKAENNIKLLMVYNDSLSGVYSLHGAIFGLRISLEPFKAPAYGKRSEELNEYAIKLDPLDPQAWMEKANIEFYKPAMFGGSKTRAVPLYEKAVLLFESSPDVIQADWIYLNCITALANAYVETRQFRQADHLYKRILRMEPDFKWIKDDVYPAFKEKHPEI